MSNPKVPSLEDFKNQIVQIQVQRAAAKDQVEQADKVLAQLSLVVQVLEAQAQEQEDGPEVTSD